MNREVLRRAAPIGLFVLVALPLLASHQVFADTPAGVSNVESFIKAIINIMVALAGLVAAAFIIIGGFSYMTSTGNPERLDRAKRTIFYAASGLAVTAGAFVLVNIVSSVASSAFGN